MNTPSPKYFCPRCSASYTKLERYCGRCGADMKRASAVDFAARSQRYRERADSDADYDGEASDDSLEPGATGPTTTTPTSWSPPRRPLDRRGGRDPWLGSVVDNRYRVVEVIGRGGMGVVYKVEHQRMGKIAAMKVLHGEIAEDPEVATRFRREAAAVSRLHHPNTVQVFDFGSARGALYLIMELVRGQDLGTLIKRDGPMAFERAAPLIGQICAALAEAHDLGIVHRDLKPENILVTRTHGGRDFVKVLDFGLAKLSEREELAEVTDRGSIVGTPYYMSPEQIRGEEVDARSDVYSMGGLLYRVVTGEHAFTAKTPVGVLTKHLTGELVAPSRRRPDLDIAPAIDRIVGRAMAKKPDDRYASVDRMLEDVERAYIEVCDDASPIGLQAVSWSASRGVPRRARVYADDEVDYGIDSDIRLQRSDLDSYEQSLRRRRLVGVIAVPLVLAAVAAVLVWLFAFRPPPVHTAESEPNDEMNAATRIAAGTEVTGFVGKRISKATPDRDFFVIPGGNGEQRVRAATVEVGGLPNLDIEVSLFDSSGKLLARADEGGVAAGETLRRVRVEGDVFVMVTEAMRPDARLPTENVSDPYTARVTLEPIEDGFEVEPNDGPADATALAPGAPIEGYLERRSDVDAYRVQAAGSYAVIVAGGADLPLRWRVGKSGERRSERRAVVTLERGAIVLVDRADREQARGSSLPGADQPYTIALEPHAEPE